MLKNLPYQTHFPSFPGVRAGALQGSVHTAGHTLAVAGASALLYSFQLQAFND